MVEDGFAHRLLTHDEPRVRVLGALHDAGTALGRDTIRDRTGLTGPVLGDALDTLQEEGEIYRAPPYLQNIRGVDADAEVYTFDRTRFGWTAGDRLDRLATVIDDEAALQVYDWMQEYGAAGIGDMGVPETVLEHHVETPEKAGALASAGVLQRTVYTAEDMRWEGVPYGDDVLGAYVREHMAGTCYAPVENVYTTVLETFRG